MLRLYSQSADLINCRSGEFPNFQVAAWLTEKHDCPRSLRWLPWDTSEDYLVSKQEQLFFLAGHAREEGFKQFLDDKTYKPGLGVYKKRDKK